MSVNIYKTLKEIVSDIILIDIISFSKLSLEQQFISAQLLTDMLSETRTKLIGHGASGFIYAMIPTGDGFYIILEPNYAGYGLLFALSLRNNTLNLLKKTNSLFQGVRLSVHLGSGAKFQDVNGGTNYVGPGLNYAARLLSINPDQKQDAKQFYGHDNLVIVSKSAWDQFNEVLEPQKHKDYYDALKLRYSEYRRIVDKHEDDPWGRFVDCSLYAIFAPFRID